MFASENQGWRAEGLAFQKRWADESWVEPFDWIDQVGSISDKLTKFDGDIGSSRFEGNLRVEDGEGPFLPSWQSAPSLPDASITNVNLLSHPAYQKLLQAGLDKGRLIMGETVRMQRITRTDSSKF